jgi:hypothetical protein
MEMVPDADETARLAGTSSSPRMERRSMPPLPGWMVLYLQEPRPGKYTVSEAIKE